MWRIPAFTVLFITVCTLGPLVAQPQSRATDFEKGTSTTQFKNRNRFKKDRYTNLGNKLPEIVRSDAKGVLYGNLCARQVAQRMGFEYVIMPASGTEFDARLGDRWRNLKTKASLVFRYGPWWKATYNRRVKKCRRSTLDHNAI